MPLALSPLELTPKTLIKLLLQSFIVLFAETQLPNPASNRKLCKLSSEVESDLSDAPRHKHLMSEASKPYTLSSEIEYGLTPGYRSPIS